MPRPNPGESETDYVGRFMASDEARRDYPDEKQRAAVAYSMFRERKNNMQICSACGAAMELNPDALMQACGSCGYQLIGFQTPPIESLNDICRQCLHPIAVEHSDFGCNIPGCSCTMTSAGVAEQIKDVLGNAAIWHKDHGNQPLCGKTRQDGALMAKQDSDINCPDCLAKMQNTNDDVKPLKAPKPFQGLPSNSAENTNGLEADAARMWDNLSADEICELVPQLSDMAACQLSPSEKMYPFASQNAQVKKLWVDSYRDAHENANASYTSFCRECQRLLAGADPIGKDAFVKDRVMHIVAKQEHGEAQALCGAEHSNASEKTNGWTTEFLKRNPDYTTKIEPRLQKKWDGASAEQKDKWGKETGSGDLGDYSWETLMKMGGSTAEVTMEQMARLCGERINSTPKPYYCGGCDFTAPDFAAAHAHIEQTGHALAPEKKNARPDFDKTIAAFEAHCAGCAKCKPVLDAPAGSDAADAKHLCATGSQLLVADIGNAEEPVTVSKGGWDGNEGPGKTFKIPPPPEKKNADDSKADAAQIVKLAEGIEHEAAEIESEKGNAGENDKCDSCGKPTSSDALHTVKAADGIHTKELCGKCQAKVGLSNGFTTNEKMVMREGVTCPKCGDRGRLFVSEKTGLCDACMQEAYDLKNAEDPILRKNLEEHKKELTGHEKTLGMAQKAGDAEGVARVQKFIDDTKKKIASAEEILKGNEKGNAGQHGPFDQPNPMGCNGCDDSRAPLNKHGYCARCAAQQGPLHNAGEIHFSPTMGTSACGLPYDPASGTPNVTTDPFRVRGCQKCMDASGVWSKEKVNAGDLDAMTHVLAGKCAKCEAAYNRQSMAPGDYCPIGANAFEKKNAGDINDLDPQMAALWDQASDAEKRRCLAMAGLGIGIIQFRWSQMPDGAKAALKSKVFEVENRNAWVSRDAMAADGASRYGSRA